MGHQLLQNNACHHLINAVLKKNLSFFEFNLSAKFWLYDNRDTIAVHHLDRHHIVGLGHKKSSNLLDKPSIDGGFQQL
ncbi:hypothetical protein HMPREF2861_07425 [Lactobacillus sp. HMSC068F07]|nr:hypothetical protein HMPREF2861_07425 [Lactobacillus sp. HMSC068F07]